MFSRLDYCNSLLIDITSDQMYCLKKNSKSCSQSHFSQKQTWGCYTTSQKASLAPSQRKDSFQDSHLYFSFLWWYPATISVILSLCVHSISYFPFQFWWKKLFPVQNENSRALVTGCSLFRRPMSGTVFLPTSDTSCSLSQCKTSLKTFLFTSAFSELPWFPRRYEIFFRPPHWLLMFVRCWFVSGSESDW